MPRWLWSGVIVLCLLSVAGCSGLRKATGLDKRSPDEFAVLKRAPLIVPPEFDLRPPVPGADRPNVDTPSQQARATLTGRPGEGSTALADRSATPAGFDAVPPLPSSQGEQALLVRTGSGARDPEIRRKISEEQGTPVPVSDALLTRLMARPAADGSATTDAPGEAERLLSGGSAAAPRPASMGSTVIEQRQTPLENPGESSP